MSVFKCSRIELIFKLFIMKNSILKLGKVLNKIEQKNINGGVSGHQLCSYDSQCPTGQVCCRIGLCFRADYPKC